jgi:hypothetical protein
VPLPNVGLGANVPLPNVGLSADASRPNMGLGADAMRPKMDRAQTRPCPTFNMRLVAVMPLPNLDWTLKKI